jgi:plastocyanin
LKARLFLLVACIVLVLSPAWAQSRVSGNVVVDHPQPKAGNSGVVVWLMPLDRTVKVSPSSHRFRLAQRHKSFEPHLLVIPLGTSVQFPNYDPFFHNVFSLYDGRRFDLGLYESGSSRTVRFDRPGVSYIFCNIHPQMSAVIITVATQWYAVTAANGQFAFTNVPPGRYRLHVWYERATADHLARAEREITVERDTQIDPIAIQTSRMPTTHKNKYGLDYDENSGDDRSY